jgi:PAS domain S-box-containing protein
MRPTVVIIDDKQENLTAFEVALRPLDCDFVCFTSGKKAVDYLLEHPVVVVLLDVQMPEMDGFEVASSVRSSMLTEAPPIIFVTAVDPTSAYIEKAYASGGADFVVKPVDARILISKVGVFLDLWHAKRRVVDETRSRSESRAEELSQSYLFVESVLQNIPNMIFVKDAENLKFVRFNKAGEELLGIRKEDLIGKSDYDLFPPEQAKAFQAKDREVLSGRQVVEIFEEPISTKDKGVRILHTKKIPVYGDNGQPRYLMGISEDITDRKIFEQKSMELIQAKIEKETSDNAMTRLNFLAQASALLGSSLDLESILKSITHLAVPTIADWCAVSLVQPDGSLKQIAVAHKDPEKVKWAWELQKKYPPDPNSKTGVAEVVRSAKSLLIEHVSAEAVRASARNEEHLKIIESLGLTSYLAVAIRTRGHVLGALTLVATAESGRAFNESDLRLAEDLSYRAGVAIENSQLYIEAKTVSRLKDEFLASLSHELRTPMNVIQGHAEILKSDLAALTPSEITASAEAILRNAKLQTGIITDLLDVSSIITGKVSYAPTRLHPVEVITALVDGLQPTASSKGVVLSLNTSAAPKEVSADPVRLNQIIWNLVSNALKFTNKNGRVDIVVSGGAEEWSISVTDSGRGIDPDFLPYVFDRFRQEDASTTRRYGGLGLGLSIVRHLAELHGGSVSASSAGPGKGAMFKVVLPLSPPPAIALFSG